MSDSIYKIFQAPEWQGFQKTGVFRGSEHDVRDGFIHLCTGHQLAATLSKHYMAINMVVLARFDASNLADIKWEIARNGEKFPHLYNRLNSTDMVDHISLTRKLENEFIIPESFLGQ